MIERLPRLRNTMYLRCCFVPRSSVCSKIAFHILYVFWSYARGLASRPHSHIHWKTSVSRGSAVVRIKLWQPNSPEKQNWLEKVNSVRRTCVRMVNAVVGCHEVCFSYSQVWSCCCCCRYTVEWKIVVVAVEIVVVIVTFNLAIYIYGVHILFAETLTSHTIDATPTMLLYRCYCCSRRRHCFLSFSPFSVYANIVVITFYYADRAYAHQHMHQFVNLSR